MASAFDILGTILGALSLLGCFKSVYNFLEKRQPFAQAELFEGTLREAYRRIDELERHGYLSGNGTLTADYRSTLARIDRESLRAREEAKRDRPQSVAAVLVHSCRHGVECTLSRQIIASTKLVRGIRQQLDYPLENPYITYSGLVPNKPKYRYEGGSLITSYRPGISDEAQAAATGTQLYKSTEGMKHRNMSSADDLPVDADITSQIFAIRAHRMQRLQERLEVFAQSIMTRSEYIYDFPSNIVRLNRQLMIEEGSGPSEDYRVGVQGPSTSASHESTSSGTISRTSKTAATGVEVHAGDMWDTSEEDAQRDAALREIEDLKKSFDSFVRREYSHAEAQNDHIMATMNNRPGRVAASSSRRTAGDTTSTTEVASGSPATSGTRPHRD